MTNSSKSNAFANAFASNFGFKFEIKTSNELQFNKIIVDFSSECQNYRFGFSRHVLLTIDLQKKVVYYPKEDREKRTIL